jgi:flagellar basal-body rod protein FlgB
MRDLLFERLHAGLGQVLDLRSQQSAMTAGNIANTDTPNYKAKFIPFDELLGSAMATDDMEMRRTHETHLSGMSGTVTDPSIEEIEAPPWALDGNSVNLEREMVRLKSNALQYSAITKGIGKRMAMLRYVVDAKG